MARSREKLKNSEMVNLGSFLGCPRIFSCVQSIFVCDWKRKKRKINKKKIFCVAMKSLYCWFYVFSVVQRLQRMQTIAGSIGMWTDAVCRCQRTSGRPCTSAAQIWPSSQHSTHRVSMDGWMSANWKRICRMRWNSNCGTVTWRP